MDFFDSPYYSQVTMQRSITRSFLWMAAGLLITGLTSAFLYSSGIFLLILVRMPMLSWILALVQIGLVVGFSASMQRASASTMKLLFVLYSITLGFTLTSLAFVYSLSTIALAFFVSALYFGCLAFIGLTTKRDLTKLGSLCMVALFALVISQIFFTIFRVGMSVRLYSILGLLIFTGVTAWDMQRMKQVLRLNDGSWVSQDKLSIFFALELYLDFINIFLYILRLIGIRSNNN